MSYSSVRRAAAKCNPSQVVTRSHLSVRRDPRGGFKSLEPLESRTLMSSATGGYPLGNADAPPGPVAVVRADAITSTLNGSYSFKVIYTDADGLSESSFDSSDLRVVGPHGYDRGAKFMSASLDSGSNGKTWVVRYKVSAPSGGKWNVNADGWYTVSMRTAQVFDNASHASSDGVLGQFVCATAITAAGGSTSYQTTNQGVNVLSFGASPNDATDDTASIQAAINALPLGDGVPTGNSPVGGIVQLGVGTYIISAPLKIPSGVILRGSGSGTCIKDISTNRKTAAILLTSPYTHGSNIGAGVQDLGITTTYAAGIRSDAMSGNLVDLYLSNLKISAAGAGVDLRSVETYHAQLTNIVVANPGSTALWIGKATNWSSAVNRIEGFRVIGTARPNFVAETALVVLGGDTTVIGGAIEETYANVLPLYIRGSSSISGLWTEYPAANCPDKTLIEFDHCTYVSIDRLVNVDSNRRLKLVESKVVNIGILQIEGLGNNVRDTVSVDGHSHLSIDTVYAQRDSGGFDDPRLSVRQAYNILDQQLIENNSPLAGANLVADPAFKTFGKTGSSWAVQWGDRLGTITGTATIEQTADGPRLKIVVLTNPNNRPVSIAVNFTTPTASVGKRGVATWRIDTRYSAQVFMRDTYAGYTAVATNTKTGARSPAALRRNEGIVFQFPSAKGTYYLSKVGMVADTN